MSNRHSFVSHREAGSKVPSFAAESLCNAAVALADVEIFSPSEGPPVTYFVLQVRIGASVWNVHRRFKDFDTLHESLSKAHGRQLVPALPPKQIIKDESAEFLQKRIGLLAEFISGVMENKVLSMTPEVCAFLECDAGSQLQQAYADLSNCTAMLTQEVHAAEGLAERAETALLTCEAEVSVLRQALRAESQARAAVLVERDEALKLARAGRDLSLGRLCRDRNKRLSSHAFSIWAAGTTPRPRKPDVGAAITNALSAAIAGIGKSPEREATKEAVVKPAAPISPVKTAATKAESPLKMMAEPKANSPPTSPFALAGFESEVHLGVGDEEEVATDDVVKELSLEEAASAPVAEPNLLDSMPIENDVCPPLESAPAAPPPPSENAIKCGLLLKQGAGAGGKYKERYFELVSLGSSGEYGAFLVYYESELKASVKGYIDLTGATVAPSSHAAEAFAFTLTTPARRLSVLTPGVAPGPLRLGNDKVADIPPSLDKRMSLIEKLDNWGRHALRNMLAEGPVNAPFTTWSLAAHSATEQQSWLDGFKQVLGSGVRMEERASSPMDGYAAIGAGPFMHAEEVM